MRRKHRIPVERFVREHDDQIGPPLLRCHRDLLGRLAALHGHIIGQCLWHDLVNEPLEMRAGSSQ